MNTTILAVFDEYKKTGTIERKSVGALDQIDELIGQKLSDLNGLIDTRPYAAFVALTSLISFVGAALVKRPDILDKLEGVIEKFRLTANALANKLGADGYSISVGFPFGISVSLSFAVAGDDADEYLSLKQIAGNRN